LPPHLQVGRDVEDLVVFDHVLLQRRRQGDHLVDRARLEDVQQGGVAGAHHRRLARLGRGGDVGHGQDLPRAGVHDHGHAPLGALLLDAAEQLLLDRPLQAAVDGEDEVLTP